MHATRQREMLGGSLAMGDMSDEAGPYVRVAAVAATAAPQLGWQAAHMKLWRP